MGGIDMAHLGMVSTDLISTNDTFAFWREKSRGLFGDLRSIVHCDGRFDGSLECATLGPLQLCKLRAGSHSVERTKPYARHDNNSYLKVVFQLNGICHFEQHGRSLTLSPGEWSIYDMRNSYRVFVPDRVEQLILLAPDDQVEGMSAHDNLMVRSFSSTRGIGRLVYELLNTTFTQLPTLSAQSERSAISTIVQLLNYSVLEFLGDDRSLSGGEALNLRARAYIMQNIRDPDLSVGRIASALHCSKRYLHTAFANNETTVDELIWKLRLGGCKKDIQDTTMMNRSITDIAFSWGFANSGHFSRRFRCEFGASARSIRTNLKETKACEGVPDSNALADSYIYGY
jgi:AraC-like DNA-binding protein